jgi:hypothetical protein
MLSSEALESMAPAFERRQPMTESGLDVTGYLRISARAISARAGINA